MNKYKTSQCKNNTKHQQEHNGNAHNAHNKTNKSNQTRTGTKQNKPNFRCSTKLSFRRRRGAKHSFRLTGNRNMFPWTSEHELGNKQANKQTTHTQTHKQTNKQTNE